MFRHERPQKGRYRQFHQVGVESFGIAGPDIDAEMILMGARLWADLGLDGIALQINSLGQPEERALHRAALIAYFEASAELLDEDAKRRLHTNPLRILDTKNPAMQELCAAAPKLIDYSALNHWPISKVSSVFCAMRVSHSRLIRDWCVVSTITT